ncbi:putative ribosome-binding factor A, mitochondrial isoform X1 [Chionomys nivalis]|uniref:putative ribosome-binding factor A, mitochondrial isoform X1 n=1 Tax=Chionomys nivalis TaxID=269649 RepID=UPI0025950631|nr:putative ribosome-binding factor A, mitochondrial isoform X1 [Chionomys nivalis]
MWAGAAGLRGSCARLQTLRGGHGAALLSGGAQALHTSVASCGSKNLLKKFASKTRKKFWYEGPSLGSHLTQKPSRFEFLTKSTLRKARKEDTIRLRALNGLLYKAVTELLCTPEVSQEVYDLNVEISKVSVTSDFSACRVYWKIGVSADLNRHTEAVLQRSAAYIRHLLLSQQTLRNVPPIVFIQDKKDVVLAEVDRLLAVADFGSPEERDNLSQDGVRSPEGLSSHNALEPATPPNLCGIDHEALNKQIMEYKRKKEKGLLPCMSLVQLSGQGPLPDVTLLRRRKKTSSRQHRDASPRSVSLGEDEDEDEDSSTEYECQAHEAEEEWEAEARSDGVQQGLHGQREQGQG